MQRYLHQTNLKRKKSTSPQYEITNVPLDHTHEKKRLK